MSTPARVLSLLRFLAKSTINAIGFDIRRVPAGVGHIVTGAAADPITCEYISHLRGTVVMDIAIEGGRAFHSLGLRLRSATHPFVCAIEAALARNDDAGIREALTDILGAYYREVAPSSALEALDLTGEQAPGLVGAPAIGCLLPWSHKSVQETIRGRHDAMGSVGLQYGRNLHVADGLTAFGPVTEAKLALEVARLRRLITSCNERGFRPFSRKSPIKVTALSKGGDYRWMIEEGQHRLAMGAAMGVASVPAMVVQVVRREDCARWPQVASGLFTETGARTLFDRIHDGVPAAICAGWSRRGEQPACAAAEPLAFEPRSLLQQSS